MRSDTDKRVAGVPWRWNICQSQGPARRRKVRRTPACARPIVGQAHLLTGQKVNLAGIEVANAPGEYLCLPGHVVLGHLEVGAGGRAACHNRVDRSLESG